MKSFIKCAALAAGLLVAGSAAAQGTWNLGTYSTAAGSCNAAGSPATATCKAGISSFSGINATMTAYSVTGSILAGAIPTQVGLTNNDPNGFGVQGNGETGTSPNHAFDNISPGGGQEFMLISFGSSKVNLSALQVGWSTGSADMSIYRWDGSTAAAVSGAAIASWTLVSSMDAWTNGVACDNQNVSGETFGSQCRTFTASAGEVSDMTNKYSSWWLVSTYIGSSTNKGLDASANDSFKLLSLTANLCTGTITGGSAGTGANGNNGSTCITTVPTGVAEPGSLAMAGLALAAVWTTRRRRPTVAA